jgi:hypothetical protein
MTLFRGNEFDAIAKIEMRVDPVISNCDMNADLEMTFGES